MAASSDFERILVKDDRIGCITDKIKYGVLKGGQNITSQSFKAISASPSAHVFNIAVPSLETIIDREVLWTCSLTLRIDCQTIASATGNKTKGKGAGFENMFAVNYGVTDALGPFALHQLVSTMTTTINNNSVSMNVQDVLPALLRMCDPDELAEYDSTTPTMLDYLANYRNGVDLMGYQILRTTGGGGTSRPAVFTVGVPTVPTGALLTATASQKFLSYPSNVLSYDMNRVVSGGKFRTPRGSFIIKRISNAATGGTIPAVGDATIYVDVQITEPLLLSPFIFGSTDNKAGFYGITNMNFQMNMSANANRAWRSVRFSSSDSPPNILTKDVYVDSVTDSKLTFTFITGHPTDQLPSRNIVPYFEMPVYRTPSNGTILARDLQQDATGSFPEPPKSQIVSSNLQLNMIPDKLIIYCRRLNIGSTYADAFLTITCININFNNNAGLLSSLTQEQLYKVSVASGLKNMSWSEFSGTTVSIGDHIGATSESEPASGFSGVGAYSFGTAYDAGTGAATAVTNTTGFQLVPTVGSVVVLNFAEVIQLTEDYYAPGSLGSFNLQVTVNVANNQGEAFTKDNWELVIIPFNSGIFVNERGTSSIYTALLTKADVLDASEQEHYSHGTIKRMVGGSLMSNLKSAMGWISSKLPFVKNVLGKVNHPYAKVGHDVLQSLGYGRGSGVSGGGSSGGQGLASRLTN